MVYQNENETITTKLWIFSTFTVDEKRLSVNIYARPLCRTFFVFWAQIKFPRYGTSFIFSTARCFEFLAFLFLSFEKRKFLLLRSVHVVYVDTAHTFTYSRITYAYGMPYMLFNRGNSDFSQIKSWTLFAFVFRIQVMCTHTHSFVILCR